MAESPLDGVKLHLVRNIDDLAAMKRWAGERRETPLMFDTETSGLSPEKDTLRLIQLGDMHHGWAVPFHMWGGGAIEVLTKYEGKLGAHNRPFDLRFLIRHAGFDPPWPKIDDTLTIAHLLNPLRPKGLKPLADRLVDPRASAGESVLHDGMKKQGWTWATVPIDFKPYWIYGAADPVLTAHIWAKLWPQIPQGGYERVYDLEQAVNRVTAMMMLRGMKVDVAYINAKLASLREFSEKTREWLREAHQVSSPMSATQISAALERLGQPVEFRTDHGFPQIDKETLAWYKANAVSEQVSQLCTYILAIRHAEKMAGTYLENLLKLRDSNDLVHASIWPLGARTGRMSITDPALQTLPRDDLVVRGAFIPHEGNVLISCDYDQIEMRLAAHFSKDEGLVEAFRQADAPGGTDFFSAIATQLFRTEISKSDRRRQMVKNMGYARLYGAGLAQMARTAGVTTDQMRPVQEAFDIRYPGLRRLTQGIISEAMTTSPPSIRTPLGRRLVADQGREHTQLVNALIQSHASEILKQAMLNLDAAGMGDAMLLPVHDELLFEVPAEQAEHACKVIKMSMENVTDYAVPVTCNPKVMAERWTGK